MIYNSIIRKRQEKKKLFGLLIDPETYGLDQLIRTIKTAEISEVDFYLVGGSLVSSQIEYTLRQIKQITSKPVLLFPGSPMQISSFADGILFLTLISGRNPDFLIGNHVVAAPYLKKTGLEVISTGYMLIGGSEVSSVEYMSNTTPIPPNKPELAVATAMAGEMLGNKLIYLEGGSGSEQTIPADLIRQVKASIDIPLIVGGGVKTIEDVKNVYRAGADILVVGNAIEQNSELLLDLVSISR